MRLAMVIYGAFALLASAGAYLALASLRGPRAGIVALLGALAFFAVLLAGLFALFAEAGLTPLSAAGAAPHGPPHLERYV